MKMKQLTAVAVFTLIQHTERLRNIRPYDSVLFEGGSYEQYGQKSIMSSMRELVNQLQTHGLAWQETDALSSLIRDWQSKYTTKNLNVDDADTRKLLLIVERIEVVLRDEIARRNFIELTPVEGMLNYNKLLSEGLTNLLGDTTWKLPVIVRQDLNEAIKCLSYGAPTASVMIGLRAVEGMLKQVHSKLTGTESKKQWKQLLDGIKNDLSAKGIGESPIFGYLDYVRQVRNEADHPDRTFTQLEAEQLFVHAIHIIKEIDKLGGT